MENVWLLQLPEKQLVLLRAIKLTVQQQRLDSSMLNCILVDKTDALCCSCSTGAALAAGVI